LLEVERRAKNVDVGKVTADELYPDRQSGCGCSRWQ
jgi:hypothetical protein